MEAKVRGGAINNAPRSNARDIVCRNAVFMVVHSYLFVVVPWLPLVHAVRWRKVNGALLEVTHDPLVLHLLSKLVVVLQLVAGVLVERQLDSLLELLGGEQSEGWTLR